MIRRIINWLSWNGSEESLVTPPLMISISLIQNKFINDLHFLYPESIEPEKSEVTIVKII